MTALAAMRPHSLVRLRCVDDVSSDAPIPQWVAPALKQAPWAVVRRGSILAERIPVGIRGRARSERFGAYLATSSVVELLSPEALRRRVAKPHRLPVFAALARVARILEGHRWGPGGSVAFELASGVETATLRSDLDIIVRSERFERAEAARLVEDLRSAAEGIRTDVIVETPRGGVSLTELASGIEPVLVRTDSGPVLCAYPWTLE